MVKRSEAKEEEIKCRHHDQSVEWERERARMEEEVKMVRGMAEEDAHFKDSVHKRLQERV